MTWQPGTLLRRRYLIEKKLGQGGFGATYLAKDKQNNMDLRVVLKKLNDNLQKDPKCVEDFKNEAQLLAQLSKKRHPNIVRIIDFFDKEDPPFLVMEYIEGDSLYQRVANQGQGLPVRDTIRWIEQIGSALHCSHTGLETPILHRDANPSNIMISNDDCAILVDFGIARMVRPNLTVGFRNDYFAPWEQNGGIAHATLDVYSLAASLYFAVTGKLPTQCEQRKMHGHSLLEPRLLRPILSDRINSAILYGMALESGDRPQTILQFLELLKEPVSFSTYVPVNPFESNKPNHVVQSSLPLVKTEQSPLTKTTQPPPPQVSQVINQKPKQTIKIDLFRFETVKLDARGKIVKKQKTESHQFVQDLGNGTKIEMVVVPKGTFRMGSPPNEEGRDIYQHWSADLKDVNVEGPQRNVKIPRLLMGKYPVTQDQWSRVEKLPKEKIALNPEPSYFKGQNRPVEQISWDEAIEFCARLRRATGLPYRLPSESEWEYTCRAGTDTPFSFGPTLNPDVANYHGSYVYGQGVKGKYREETTDVDSFPANGFGLYDMHGNVWEWCQDVWQSDYSRAPTDGSAQLSQQGNELYRLLRGGSWDDTPWYCRSADRVRSAPGSRRNVIGFRVACSLAS
jgi:formylglycine-generating enzyme required for sulfatase activity/tRNA A-37 threonylcarbamoyl transferase component Bud32